VAEGDQAYFETNLENLDDELIERLIEHLLRRAAGRDPRAPDGRRSRPDAAGSAFPDRSMPFLVNVVTGWHDAAAADAHIDWARGVVASGGRVLDGRGVRQLPLRGRLREGRLRPGDHKRLVALKRIRPDQRLPAQQNIEP
jgi:hypothetical protein